MSFVSCTPLPISLNPTPCFQVCPRVLPCHTSTPLATLSDPNNSPKFFRHQFFPQSNPYSHSAQPEDDDYDGWSREFIDLCTSQFSLLASTIPSLREALLFFRRENPTNGALEFVPLIAHSSQANPTSRVWISSGAAGETALEPGSPCRVLPGGIPAEWIIPDYPFKSMGAVDMPDGRLCVPVEYNGVLAGSVVLVPETASAMQWTNSDVHKANMVARSIAMAAALEGKWRVTMGNIDTSKQLIDSMRDMLRVTLHQVRSPLTALITFGHLLLHKLPPGDSNRALAKNIILEALRVDDLIKPLDTASETHVLPEVGRAWYEAERSVTIPADIIDDHSVEMDDSPRIDAASPVPQDVIPTEDLQLLWLSDVIEPQAEVTRILAETKGQHLLVDIDTDTPAVLAVEKYVRESVRNLLDNSLKYSPRGAYIGLSCITKDIISADGSGSEEVVEVQVWDTGYGFTKKDMEDAFHFGYRGSAASEIQASGSGIGLSAVRDMVYASGGTISLVSPLPSQMDPRLNSKRSSQKFENHLHDPDYSAEEFETPGSLITLTFKRPS